MKVGRQRSFDKQVALNEAMLVFWKNGYPGTSLTELTTAMGINKPSMYSAFGNKEQLFIQAIDLYLKQHGLTHASQLANQSLCLRKRVENYLMSIAEMLTNAALPTGCLICVSTSEVAGECLPDGALNVIANINEQTKSYLSAFFDQEIIAGNIIAAMSAESLAEYLLTLQFGLAVAARNGSSRESLNATISLASAAFN